MPTAYFLLNVALNHETDVINEIKQVFSDASMEYEIQGVFGVYDIVVKISSDDEDKITKVTVQKIRNIDNIQSVVTMMVNDEQD